MNFHDFKGIWHITRTDGTERETVGHWVAIGGKPQAVHVVCIDDRASHSYPIGTYAGSTIQGEGYTLTLVAEGLRCQSDALPGSWTADDNIPPFPRHRE